MDDEETKVRFLFSNPNAAKLVYLPPKYDGPKVIDATSSFKYSQALHILNDSWVVDIGRSRWDRFLLRIKHPIIYSKRGILGLYRRIKRIFVKPKMIQPLARHPYDRGPK